MLAQAPRDEPAVLVADLDLDQRRDWLELFPFLATRRPDAYSGLTDEPGEVGRLGGRQRLDRLAELVGRDDRGQDRQRDAAGDEGARAAPSSAPGVPKTNMSSISSQGAAAAAAWRSPASQAATIGSICSP